SGPGTNIIFRYESARWINTSTTLGTGWHHVVMTIDSSGVPSLHLDGSFIASYAGANSVAPAAGVKIGGALSTQRFSGSVDDIRFYNRTLSNAEVLQLYQAGPK